MVIAFHATIDTHSSANGAAGVILAIARYGWLGVPIFFVISGYCIAACLDGERKRLGHPGAFLFRRAVRIYPPYWILVAICAAVVGIVEGSWRLGFFETSEHPINQPQSLSTWQWIGALTLSETWRYHIAGEPIRHFLGHSWSLCYEVQFYAVAALALWAAPRRPLRTLGFVSLVALFGRHIAWNFVPVGGLDGFFFDGTWFAFAAGIVVYHQVSAGTRSALIVARLALLAGIAYAVRDLSAVELSLLVACSYGLLLSQLHRWDDRLASTTALRPLTACGKIGYSLYLVHWPLVKGISHGLQLLGVNGPVGTLVLTLPLCTIVSVAVAAAFHRFVEQRFHFKPVAAEGRSAFGQNGSPDRCGPRKPARRARNRLEVFTNWLRTRVSRTNPPAG
jgi:peptidoglycan/LPS O-acetylase OafA/YrhL